MCTEIMLIYNVDIAPDLCVIRSVKQSEKFKLRDLVT